MNTKKIITALFAVVFAVTAFDASAKKRRCRKGVCSRRSAVVAKAGSTVKKARCSGGSCSRR